MVNDPSAISLSAEAPVVKEVETKEIDEGQERRKDVAYSRFINQRNRTMRRFNKIIRKELRLRRERIVDGIRNWTGGGIPEIDLSVTTDGAALYQAVLGDVTEAIGESADDWGETLDKEKAVKAGVEVEVSIEDFAIDNPQIREFLENHLLAYTKGMTETQLANLIQVLADNVAETDLSKLARAIQSADTSFTEVQTRRAIQTWSTSAINLGALEAGRRFGTPNKSWISQKIGEPRDWHIALEGQKPIGQGEAWNTPFGSLLYPGDPNASPKDLYNCSCVLINEE